jgi:hypothetical protein
VTTGTNGSAPFDLATGEEHFQHSADSERIIGN